MTGDAKRLREVMVGPDGLSPDHFDALIAGWDPAEAPLLERLICRGFLDRIGAQTLGTVIKGYVRLSSAQVCNLFKSLPGGARPAAAPAPRSASSVPAAPSEPPAQEFARLSLRAQISELRAQVTADRSRHDLARRPSEAGDRCAQYTLLRPIGEGEHTLVFQARTDHDPRTVALKLPRPHAVAASLPRFAEQGKIHMSLKHAGVVPLLDAGHGDAVYLAYADMGAIGISHYLRRLGGRIQAWTLAQLLVDVAQALDAAVKVGVVHGDLTPANILMCEHDARVRLTDFGMRIPGAPPGPFTAPELADGDRGTAQSDMYSLGVILQREAVQEAAAVPLRHGRPDLPSGLVTLIDRMTARSPNRRPSSWGAAIDAVLSACPRVAGPFAPNGQVST